LSIALCNTVDRFLTDHSCALPKRDGFLCQVAGLTGWTTIAKLNTVCFDLWINPPFFLREQLTSGTHNSV